MAKLVEVKDLTKKYKDRLVLDKINLSVQKGEIIALLGQNGAGKSTLINLINHLAQPSSGDIQVNLVQSRIAVMLQDNIVLDRVKVGEAIRLSQSYYRKPMVYSRLLYLSGLKSYEKSLVTQLSGGQKRRLNFALALAGDPDLIFLDEPTTGMDAEHRVDFWREITQLKNLGKTLFITSHYLEELENVASRLIFLNQHKVSFDGTLTALRSQYANSEITFNFSGNLPSLTGLVSFSQTGDYYQLTTNDSNDLVKQLISLFDQGLTNLTIQPNSLDSLFKNMLKNDSPNQEDSNELV